jgi:uncharacterized membrane protein YtjA (UPF0391 family)
LIEQNLLSLKNLENTAILARKMLIPVRGDDKMLWYTWVFLIIALIAAVLGFGGIAAAAGGIAKICFVVFLVLFLISFLTGRRGAV